MASVAYAASESGSVSKTITATVLPTTATNKAVDWSVEWGDSSNTATVTDYVTVTPDSDGSTNATITCYQAFSGNILVSVTTRENGYSASCIITFVGIPTEMTISGSVIPYSTNTYDLGIGNSYTFNVALSNPFNSVSSTYNNYTCTLAGVGSINVGYMEHFNSSGNDVWYDTSNAVLTLDSIKNSFIAVGYENGTLTIATVKSIESYYASSKRIDSGRTVAYTDKFRSYVDDCYFTVTITEITSGISQVMKIRFNDSVVTGVNASVSEMSF
ncbi:MAG: hypothetical protein PHW00_03235 [Clostridia bacterium]|nr:hypothetical protein [Clostridia bacterium]